MKNSKIKNNKIENKDQIQSQDLSKSKSLGRGPTKIQVYDYDDYRKYLKDKIEERKRLNKPFSYRWFSQKANFTSPNFLNLVIHGQRHLSLESIEKVAEVFGLTADEKKFFRSLVLFNKSKTPAEKELYAHELLEHKKFSASFPLKVDQYEYLSHWHLVAIRELLTLKNAPQSAREIAKRLRPQISLQEAEQGLKTLESLGLISFESDGKYKVHDISVTTGDKVTSAFAYTFHRKMIGLSQNALELFHSSERDISAVSIPLSKESFLKAKELVRELRRKLMDISAKEVEANEVYQFNFQLFPLSKTEEVIQEKASTTKETPDD